MKTCSKCKLVLPLEEFAKDRCQSSGYSPSCRNCRAHGRRKHQYGLEQEEYINLLEVQQYCCAICGVHQDDSYDEFKRGFHVDHDHETGRVRALLCSSCNRGIGFMKDDPNIVQKAADYLNKHKENRHR